jgi:hypothetical protein
MRLPRPFNFDASPLSPSDGRSRAFPHSAPQLELVGWWGEELDPFIAIAKVPFP